VSVKPVIPLGMTSAPSVARSVSSSGGVGQGSHELASQLYSVTTAPWCFAIVASNSAA
jgi:hypothetical protein